LILFSRNKYDESIFEREKLRKNGKIRKIRRKKGSRTERWT
jgi:hypothetical protein